MEDSEMSTKTINNDKLESLEIVGPSEAEFRTGWRFWMSIVTVMIITFISALELTVVATALPTIIKELNGTQFIWVGSAYTLSTTAFLPLSGALAEAFGRRPVMLGLLTIFVIGSALCGAAKSLNFLIAGRAIQGLGGGGMASVSQIVISDLVPLRLRGSYIGLIVVAWGFACCTGPVIGGALAEHGHWRWIFYMNLPICGFAAVLTIVYLQLRIPPGTTREKLAKVDWLGNFIVVASTASTSIGLTWGGVQFPWSSAHVLVPLIIGLVGLVLFFLYEGIVAKNAIVPYSLLSTRTGLSGYVQTFLGPFILIAAVYYIPVYFQACKDASPITSGVDSFGVAMPPVLAGIVAGVTIKRFKKYRPQLWIAWCLMTIGCGLMSTVTAELSRGHFIGYEVVFSFGLGMLYSSTYFPVLAPLPVSANAKALSLFMFLRYFAQVWGVTIGGTILQNGLRSRLPEQFIASFPRGVEVAYSIIPLIKTLQEPFKKQVQDAFAESLQVMWRVMIAFSGLGFLVSLMMKGLPLHTEIDREWGLQGNEGINIQEA